MMVRNVSLACGLALAALACGGGNEQQAKAPEATSTTSGDTTGGANGTSGATSTTGMAPTTSATGATGTGTSAMPTDSTSGMGSSATGTGTTSTGTGSMGSTSGGAGSTGSSAGTSSAGAMTLSDEQIAAITAAANKGEVDEAKVAQQKAKDPRVKKFAAMMVTDHGAALTKQDALVKKNKLAPSENAVSQQLASDVQSTVSTLQSLAGTDFDHAYIDAQVRQHQQVLDTIDQKLLPQVKNADLKAAITSIRPTVEHHLKEAQDIQKTLK